MAPRFQVDCVVLGPGDEVPATLGEGDVEDEDLSASDLQSMVLMPPAIEVQGMQLRVRVHKAEGLPKLDNFGGIDAYVTVRYGGNTGKTKVVKKDRSPTFNQEIALPFQTPTMTSRIEARLVVDCYC